MASSDDCDITVRLRDWARFDRTMDREEAADEIDRLRDRLALYQKWLNISMKMV